MTITTIDELLDYWPGNIPFKGQLVSDDGSCMCAQGQALHFLGGMTADDLRQIGQAEADKRVAELFSISRAHAVLLRQVNDSSPGAPSVVIRDPAKVLGDQAPVILAFWRHLDRMTAKDWDAALAPTDWVWRDMAFIAALAAAGAAAWAAAAAAAGAAAWDTAWAAVVAAEASNEIQGAAIMRERGQPFYFLPLFGFADPEAVLAE